MERKSVSQKDAGLEQKYKVVEKVGLKYDTLRERYIAEGQTNKGIAEDIVAEVIQVSVEALIESGGHSNVMMELENRFIKPILKTEEKDTPNQSIFRIMVAHIATETAQRLYKD